MLFFQFLSIYNTSVMVVLSWLVRLVQLVVMLVVGMVLEAIASEEGVTRET
jgi:hypothetical protein